MAVFFIEDDTRNQGKHRRRDIIIVVTASALVLGAAYKSATTGRPAYFLSIIPVFISFLAPALNRLVVKAKRCFVDVNGTNIVFRTGYEKNVGNTRIVDWNDIKWIKKEQNDSITLYQQSSFAETIALAEFAVDARENITREIKEGASTRGIQLANF
jgi:hypothetical protein